MGKNRLVCARKQTKQHGCVSAMVANVDFSSILSLNKVEGVNTEYIWLGII